MKNIVLTGGGTAGHVTPHFALLDYFNSETTSLYYIGSKNGIEKQLVESDPIALNRNSRQLGNLDFL